MPAKTQNDRGTSPSKGIQGPKHQAWGAQNKNASGRREAKTVTSVESQRKADLERMMGWSERPQDCHTVQAKGKAWKFYRQIPWGEWWDDFSTATEPNGRLRYRSVRAFIHAKTSNAYERELLWEMIGPRHAEKALRVPYLGDWQKRRTNSFWAFEDPTKLASIANAIEQEDDRAKAIGAIAPLAAKQIQRYARLAEKIDEAFGGQPLLADLPPDDPKNKARFEAYVHMHKMAFAMESKGWEGYWLSHGLSTKDPTSWVTMLGAVPEQHTISPGEAKVAQLWDEVTRYDVLLASNMRKKAEMYPGLELPDINPPDKPDEDKKAQ